jgi:hypothetical protein
MREIIFEAHHYRNMPATITGTRSRVVRIFRVFSLQGLLTTPFPHTVRRPFISHPSHFSDKHSRSSDQHIDGASDTERTAAHQPSAGEKTGSRREVGLGSRLPFWEDSLS